MKLVQIKEKIREDTKWPIDCILGQLDDFDEVLILAKRKEENSYTRFSSKLNDTFWWLGVLEAMKRNLLNESVVQRD